MLYCISYTLYCMIPSCRILFVHLLHGVDVVVCCIAKLQELCDNIFLHMLHYNICDVDVVVCCIVDVVVCCSSYICCTTTYAV